jgi:2-oxoglutarate dehydrogenase E1 component
LIKILRDRAQAVPEDAPIDWGTAEALAMGSLLLEGTLVRLTGQDSRRGTFSHRHAALRDVETAELYVPLNHMRPMSEPHFGGTKNERDVDWSKAQAPLWVYDSPLSEFSCMGFEYGFSLASPKPLVIWEAQFGDFVNGAQVIIDQYLAAAETKWQRWSGLTLLLPHGYEGQGPEHSSARIERFLELCGGTHVNLQVCHPTTPAQYFHLLRRQVHAPFRKPLIVMTPKSLLRLPVCTSRVAELVTGSFQEVLDDPMFAPKGAKKQVKRIILCSGKVYYDLAARREETSRGDVAIVRVEMLYPLNIDRLQEVLSSYPKGVELVWVQEEPKNMGAWGHMFLTLNEALGWELPYIGRPVSSSPATGSPSKHLQQLDEFLSDAIAPLPAGAAKAPVGAH